MLIRVSSCSVKRSIVRPRSLVERPQYALYVRFPSTPDHVPRILLSSCGCCCMDDHIGIDFIEVLLWTRRSESVQSSTVASLSARRRSACRRQLLLVYRRRDSSIGTLRLIDAVENSALRFDQLPQSGTQWQYHDEDAYKPKQLGSFGWCASSKRPTLQVSVLTARDAPMQVLGIARGFHF